MGYFENRDEGRHRSDGEEPECLYISSKKQVAGTLSSL